MTPAAKFADLAPTGTRAGLCLPVGQPGHADQSINAGGSVPKKIKRRNPQKRCIL